MQKIINGIAIFSGAVALGVVGLGGYVFIRKDAIIDNVKSKIMESVLPGGLEVVLEWSWGGLGVVLGWSWGGLWGGLGVVLVTFSPLSFVPGMQWLNQFLCHYIVIL